MAHNPFENIDSRLSNIEEILSQLVSSNKAVKPKSEQDFKYQPIQEIFDRKLMSKPTFYKYLKEGKFSMYKFGGKSFINQEEFEETFHRINFNQEPTRTVLKKQA